MSSPSLYNDSELLLLFKAGDEMAAAQLYNRYYKALAFFGQEIVQEQQQAEDLAQEAFIKVWNRRNQFNTLAELKSYLYISVKHAAFDLLSHRQVRERTATNLQQLQPKDENYIEAQMMFSELMVSVFEEIRALPPMYAQVLELLFLQDLPSHEVAEKLSLSPENLRIRKFRAISMLRSELLRKGFSASSLIYFYFLVTNR